MCAAPVGNQYWKARTKHGRDAIFENPKVLWDAAQEYFEWVDSNPLKEQKVFNGKDGIVHADVEKMRAMTIRRLCTFLDIDQSTWREYRAKQDFSRITTRVEAIIWAQKFEGAAADLLNPSIIARELGLADRKEHSGPDGKPIETKDVSYRERLKALLDRTAEQQKGQE